MRLFTHILEELTIRGGGFSEGFLKDATLPNPSWPDIPKSVVAQEKAKVESDKPQLFKFGKKCHLEKMREFGHVRIAPASFYGDPSLNYAIRDDELSFTLETHPGEIRIQKIDKRSGQPEFDIEPVSNVSMTMPYPTDYWVFCMALSYPLRAFDDFEADACLVVNDCGQFVERLTRAMAGRTGMESAQVGSVDYLDPLTSKPNDVKPFFAKHFRYAYQEEFRMVWAPSAPVSKLEPVLLELGSIKSISEILTPD